MDGYQKPKFDYVALEVTEITHMFGEFMPTYVTDTVLQELYRQLFDKMTYSFRDYSAYLFTLPNLQYVNMPVMPPEVYARFQQILALAGTMLYGLCNEHKHFHPDEADTFPYFLEHITRDRAVLRFGYTNPDPDSNYV